MVKTAATIGAAVAVAGLATLAWLSIRRDSESAPDAKKSSPSPKESTGSNLKVVLLCNHRAGSAVATQATAYIERSLSGNVHRFPLTADGIQRAFACVRHLRGMEANVRVVVSGGDGSVGWVVSEMQSARLQDVPVGILPLGTGNDMACELGWGVAPPTWLEKPRGARHWLESIETAKVHRISVWKAVLRVDPSIGSLTRVRDHKEVKLDTNLLECSMINYCSVGLDARLVYEVERRRQPARWRNKVVYGLAGTWTVLTPAPVTSNHIDSVSVNGWPVNLHALKRNLGEMSVLSFLNIGTYGGGTRIWDMARDPPVSSTLELSKPRSATADGSTYPQIPAHKKITPDSGLLHVLGARTLFQLGSQVGTKIPWWGGTYRLASGSSIELSFTKDTRGLYIQFDGEAYCVDHPVELTLKRSGTATMLDAPAAYTTGC